MGFLYGNVCTLCSIILIALLIILSIVKKLERTRLAINIILFMYGLFGSITYPSYLSIRLSSSLRTNKEFINWASIKFHNYTSILAIITIIILTAALLSLFFNNKHESKSVKILVVFTQILLIIMAVILGIFTVNKIFDLGASIVGMGYYNALVLFGIFLVENLIRKKMSYN